METGFLGNRSPYSPEMTQLLGLDPAEMRRQAIFRGLQQAGVQLMQSGKLGDAFQGLSEGVNEAKDDYMQQQMLGYKMKMDGEDRAYKNEQRDAERAKQEAYNQWVSTLPEHLRPAVMANPGLGVDYAQATYPELQQPVDPLEAEYKRAQIDKMRREGTPGANRDAFAQVFYHEPTKTWYNRYKDGTVEPIKGLPGDTSFIDPESLALAKARGAQVGESQGTAAAAIPGAAVESNYFIEKANEIKTAKGKDSALGYGTLRPDMLSSADMVNFRGKLDELGGGAFLQARQQLKGGGAITDFESKRAEGAYSRIQKAVVAGDPVEFDNAVDEYVEAINMGLSKLQAQAGGVAPAAPGGTTSSGIQWSVE